MATNAEPSAPDDGPHVESSDSDISTNNSLEESSDSDSVSTGTEQDDEVAGEEEQVEYHNKDAVIPDATCVVHPNGSKTWTPNCDEKYKPHTNKHFLTLEDAFIFYQEYGRQCGFDVRKSSQRSDKLGNVISKYIQCSHGGSPNTDKAKLVEEFVTEGSQIRRTTSKRCYCPAQINMKLAGLGGYVVMSFVEEHNHPLATGSDTMFLRCNRNISIALQNFIIDCSRANIGATRAYTIAKEMVGSYEDIGATVSDFKNFSRDVKVRIKVQDANQILSRFKVNKLTASKAFYYDYKVDREGHLTGLFWTDAIAQANYEVFGDIVSFDPTFRTNRYNLVFIPFTGVDNHWKNVTFAGALLAKEDYKNFKWLLQTFKKAMGFVPACVITDQCAAIKKAIQIHWPSVKHRLCMWHIMQKIPAKLGHNLSSNKKFIEKLKAVVYSDHSTPVEFEEGWNSLIAEYKLEGNKWLSSMFRKRKTWIPAYFSNIEMAGLLRTTSRSESSNSFFQHFHECGDTLTEFYSSFESAMDKQRLSTAEDNKRSRQTPRMETRMQIEKHAAEVYTLSLYYLVREEISSACYHTSMTDMTRDNEYRHFICKDEMLHGKLFKVSVRESDNQVDCSCKLYFRKGFLCRHAFAALHQCSVHTIPQQFIKPRWTKNALNNHSTLGRTVTLENDTSLDRKKLKRTRAWFQFNTCMDYAGDDEDKLDIMMTGMQEMTSKLYCNGQATGIEEQPHRAEKFVGPIVGDDPLVQNPLQSRNKGCGSRIKSAKEIAVQTKKQRTCSICNKTEGHNARTCPMSKNKQV